MDIMDQLTAIPAIGPYLPYIMLMGVVASIVATALPAPGPASGAAYAGIYRAVNWLALNIGHARNAGDVEAAPPKSPPGSTGAALIALCLALSLSACASSPPPTTASATPMPTTIQAVSAGATAVAPSAVAIVNNISPAVVTDLNAACPTVQGALAALLSCAGGGATGSNSAIVQAQNFASASCTEAGKLQLAVNDATAAAAGPTASNSGNSKGWLLSVANDAIAVAPYACPVAKAILAAAK